MSDFVIEDVVTEEMAGPADPKPAEKPKEVLVDSKGQHVILFEEYVACMIGDDKSEISKLISYEDFSNIVGTILNHRNEDTMEGFHLPNNCFFYAKSSSAMQLSCYYPECDAEVQYNSAKYLIRVPNMIVSHNLVKHNQKIWKHNGARYFATDQKVGNLPKKFISQGSPSERVFGSPFPNTYQEGHMCVGGNSMPLLFTDNNLRGLQWYYKFLFESPFNADLGIRGITGDPSIESWFKTLANVAKDKKAFPYDKLRNYTKPA
jgi:hypothetical protein